MKETNQHIKAAYDQVDSSDYDHEALWQSIESSLPRKQERYMVWLRLAILFAVVGVAVLAIISTNRGEALMSPKEITAQSACDVDYPDMVYHNGVSDVVIPAQQARVRHDNNTASNTDVIATSTVPRATRATSTTINPKDNKVQGSPTILKDAVDHAQASISISKVHNERLTATESPGGSNLEARVTNVLDDLQTGLKALPLGTRIISPKQLLPLVSPSDISKQFSKASVEFSITYGLLDDNLKLSTSMASDELLHRQMQENALDMMSTELRYFRRVSSRTEVFVGLQYSQQTTNRQAQDVTTDTMISNVLVQRLITQTDTTEIYEDRAIPITTVTTTDAYNRLTAWSLPIGIRQYLTKSRATQFFIEGEITPALVMTRSGSIQYQGQVYDIIEDQQELYNNSMQLSFRLSAGLSTALTSRTSINVSAGYWQQLTDTYNTDTYPLSRKAQAISLRLSCRYAL